ncbi:MAG: hypothetical protein AAGJ83_07780, partial [Planctomycetota bacterium]
MKRWLLLSPLAACVAAGFAWQYQATAQEVAAIQSTGKTYRSAKQEEAALAAYEALTISGQQAVAPGDRPAVATGLWAQSPGAVFIRRSTSESDKQAMEAAAQYLRESDDEKKEVLMDKVKNLVAKAFDDQMAEREKEIELVQKQLDELKAKMKSRKELGDQIIERRIRQLTKQSDQLDWFEGSSRFPTAVWGHPYPAEVPATPRLRRGVRLPA